GFQTPQIANLAGLGREKSASRSGSIKEHTCPAARPWNVQVHPELSRQPAMTCGRCKAAHKVASPSRMEKSDDDPRRDRADLIECRRSGAASGHSSRAWHD